ncbi:BTB/POZ domain-containing protein [Striga asiatica]|uniref:BTB/POZ domain-containing protein n=1 Tax=Striga asiatica TaxID=4170 RepID=A0A5A7PKB7_STRAF|nr:BTB/POZ domain-containing protein [Striga asiatica]
MAATTTRLKFQTQPIKPKRRRCRETTITTSTTTTPNSSASAAGDNGSSSSAAVYINQNHSQSRRLDTPIIVSSDNSWCCPASKLPTPPPVDAAAAAAAASSPSLEPSHPPLSSSSSSSSDLKIRHSPSDMDSYQNSVYGGGSAAGAGAQENFPSSLSKFNSALTAGLLNPMSPPPLVDKARSSPTLFEMMANEPECLPRTAAVAQNGSVPAQNGQSSKLSANPPPQDRQALMQQRLMDILASRSPGNLFNDAVSGDVKLTLSSKDGLNVSMSVHRQILVVHSRFFALKLNEKWVKQQRSSGPYIVEIADCDDIEVYIETLRLMYCKDLRRKLMKEDVPRVLGILKVSAAIGFDAGVLSCLEYLEAAPWAEDEEQKIASLLSELRLEGVGAGEVLKRVSLDSSSGAYGENDHEQTLLKLLQVVLEGKDEKARREMKSLMTKMLRENSSQNDLSKESLYSACNSCLKSLSRDFLRAAEGDDPRAAGLIARQADNLQWLLDIMIDRQVAEDFLRTWASQSELAGAHCKVPAVHRFEVSRVTARLFVGIGKAQLLASKEARCMLVRTWLGPFYEDFGWMRRASRGLDRHLVEEGLANTILTLPMSWQQEIMMSWFDRFLNSGEDCPNIQRGFEVWWRRAFWRRNGGEGPKAAREMRVVAAADVDK